MYCWGNGPFSNSLCIWFDKYIKYYFKNIARLVTWNIWKLRNFVFFEAVVKSVNLIVDRAIKSFKELGVIPMNHMNT